MSVSAPSTARLTRLVLVGALALGVAGPAPAQQAGKAGAGTERPANIVPRSPILVVDSERLFEDSRFAQQLSERLEERASEIAAENRKLEAQLAEEERELTEKRAEMDPAEFRKLAEAFDEKVTRIRRERGEEAAGLSQDSEEVRREFLRAVEPVLDRLMQDAGSAVILERRTVFVTRDVVDITDEAIQRIDDALLQPEDERPAAPDQTGGAVTDGGGGNAPSDDEMAPALPGAGEISGDDAQ